MSKVKGLRFQIAVIEIAMVVTAFLVLCFVSTSILKNEIENQWMNIGVAIDTATLSEIATTAFWKLFVIAAIASTVVNVSLLWVIRKKIIRPVNILSKNLEDMANYKLTSTQDGPIKNYMKKEDEIGTMCRSFFEMQDSIATIVRRIEEVSAKLENESGELKKVTESVKTNGAQLSLTVDEVAGGAMSQAQRTTDGNTMMIELGKLVDIVSNNMQSLYETATIVESIKKQGDETLNELIEKTTQNHENSIQVNKVMDEAALQVEKITEASEGIRRIAGQTSLLALNASIEAARAGDVGKGFAVVATEIGNLSNQTNQLTGDIEQIIQELVERVNDAVETIKQMEEASSKQNASVEATKQSFEEIMKNMVIMKDKCDILDESTVEMEKNERLISDVISELSSISQENAACMEEASASVSSQETSITDVDHSSKDILDISGILKDIVHKFEY